MKRALVAALVLGLVGNASAAEPKVRTAKKPAKKAKRLKLNMPRGWSWPPTPAMEKDGKRCLADLDRLGVNWKPARRVGRMVTPVVVEDMTFGSRPGIERAHAMVAILDGPAVDDGTACEIGMFHALMQADPSKKGIVGLLTDIRGARGESSGVNLFVQGAIEDVGRIVTSIEEACEVLRAWR